MASQQPGVWGIDIGQCALKALRLEIVDDQVKATAFDYVEHPKILSQPDADPDQLTREALEKFLSRNSLKGDQVAVGVPGQSGLARFVKLPPVEEKKIGDIVRFEAKQQIPFPLHEVIWDFQKLGSGAVTDGFAMETEIGLFAIKKDMIHRALQQFKDVNIEVHVVQMMPLALCNFVSYDLLKKGAKPDEGGEEEGGDEESAGKKRCIVALDIGTDNSNLVVTDGERIIWQRPMPHGGNHFTRALTKDLKLTFAKAEHLKRNATRSPDLKKILSALKPVLNEFVGEVQRSLGYFTNSHRNAQIVYIMGLGNAFRLPGLQKFLSEKLQIEVRKLAKLNRLSGEDSVLTAPAFAQNLLSFAGAYGLALQGLNETRLHTNLLPEEIRTERLVRAKKPLAVTAAAALLLGLAAMMAGYGLQYKAVAAPSVLSAIAAADQVFAEAENNKRQFEAKLQAILADEDKVRGIIAGQDERLDWLVFNEYVNDGLPLPALRIAGQVKNVQPTEVTITDNQGKDQKVLMSPNGVFVMDPAIKAPRLVKTFAGMKAGEAVVVYAQQDAGTRTFWDAPGGLSQKAFLDFWERQAKGAANASGTDQDLLQVNVEALDARYTPDLKAVFGVKDDPHMKNLDAIADKDRKELPEGAGWLVEVRGYTYFRQDKIYDFLKGCLVEKLAGLARPEEPPKPAEAGTPPTEAAPKPKKSDKEELWDKVIRGKVSHVFLYHYVTVKNPHPLQFQIIGNSVLPAILAGAAKAPAAGADAGAGGEAPKPKAAVAGPPNWQSLLQEGAPPAPAPVAGGVVGAETGPATGQAGPARTEFIVLMVWKEPLPSDERKTKAEGEQAAAGGRRNRDVRMKRVSEPPGWSRRCGHGGHKARRSPEPASERLSERVIHEDR